MKCVRKRIINRVSLALIMIEHVAILGDLNFILMVCKVLLQNCKLDAVVY